MDGLAIGVLAAALLVWLRSATSASARGLARVLSSDWALLFGMVLYLVSLIIRNEVFRETLHYSLQSLAAAVIIVYGLLPRRTSVSGLFDRVLAWRPIQVVGLASYSIYLVHFVIAHGIDWIAPGLPRVAMIPLKIVVGVGAGIVMWRLVERPVERLKDRVSAWRADRRAS